MTLAIATLRKLLREHLPDEPGLKLAPEALAESVATLKDRLLALPGIEDVSGQRYYSGDRQKPLLVLALREPGTQIYDWRRTELELYSDPEQGLVLSVYGERKPVSDPQSIVALVRACQAALQRRRANDVKREKLRNLKSQAIVARIKSIAREDGFDFATQADRVKLKLYVRLGEREIMEILIPFKRFEEILPRLRETIADIRKLHADGIRFSIKQSEPRVTWIDHRKL
jgi:hypothetical protein